MRKSHLLIFWILFSGQITIVAFSQSQPNTCKRAIVYKSDDFAVADIIKICSNSEKVPVSYEAKINTPVCDDKLCANVILMFYWDLAGNYIRFDTLSGKPLTKFDKKKFTNADYKRLDQILKDQNSMLRILEKKDLIDKSIQVRATTVDAVTGATPTTVKNAVVEGAVYTTYTLWHFINGSLKDSIRSYTNSIYSWQVARQLLYSGNYETQLFGLKKLDTEDYDTHFHEIADVMVKSVPLIKAYLVSKVPIPFQDVEKNKKLVSLFTDLDVYSKSIFLDRISENKQIATIFIPLMKAKFSDMDDRQKEKIALAAKKYDVAGF